MSYIYTKKGVWSLNEVTDKINLNSWNESKGREFYTVGFNTTGSTGSGFVESKNSPTQIGGLWDNFSAGDGYCLATKSDGSLWAWGRNNHGQLGTRDTRWYSSPTQITAPNGSYWRFISASKQNGNHSLAIKQDGTLWAWGLNNYGQLGLSGNSNATDYYSRTNISAPIGIFGADWSLCSAGALSSLAIRGEGSLYCWGYNGEGQLGVMNSTTNYSSPVQVPGRWKYAQMYDNSTLGIIAGTNTLYCWGNNNKGQLGRSNTSNSSSPILISEGWKQVKGGGSVVVGIKTDGTLWAWGNGEYGTLGQDIIVRQTSPVGVLGTAWASISSSKFGSHTLAVRNNNTLFHFGSNTYGQSGLSYSGDVSTQSSPTQIIGNDWAFAGAGVSNSYCVRQNGTMFAWGANYFGEIGNNAPVGINSSSPTQIPGTSWVAVYANGDGGAFALRNDASLYAWGKNNLGQIGVGDTAHRSSPTQIPGTTWAGVAPGRYHTLLLRSDSSLFGVGINTNGEIGNNNRGNAVGPVQVLGNGYDNPSAGDGFSVSKKTDGTLWAWGNNDAGQLGQLDRITRSSPTQIPGTDWRRVEAGPAYVVAIKENGTIWGWGDNTNGVFGIENDTTLFYSSPVQIGAGSTGWDYTSSLKISSGSGKIFLTKTEQSHVYFMGADLNPGFNLSQNYSSPVQIPGTNWDSLDMSETTVIARRTDGTIWNWGNVNFPLSGSRTSLPEFISSPVQIVGNAWVNVSVGKSFIVGTKY